MKALNIVNDAYRATLEEQDDTVVWITQAMRNAGADLDVLLRGNAVNYAVKGQDASGLRFGEERQTQPPRIEQDLSALRQKGARIYFIEEDMEERGISPDRIIPDLQPVHREALGKLFADYDRVWQW